MSIRKTRKASWLLTVASAYSVLPGCSDDPSTKKPDANMATYDGGLTVTPPHKADAGTTQDSGEAASDSGSDADDPLADLDIPTLIGVIIFPPGGGDLPDMDASATDTPSADDASAEADGKLPVDLTYETLRPPSSSARRGPPPTPR
jgi:hypothetical protein